MTRFIGKPKQFGGIIGRKGGAGGIGANVRVLGIPAAVAKLKGVDSVVRLQLGLLTLAAAEHMAADAREFAPSETGNLRSGIKVEKLAPYNYQVTSSSQDGDDPAGIGKNNYEYAPFVEYGTKYMDGFFYMTRAYEEVKPLVAVELKVLAKKLEAL